MEVKPASFQDVWFVIAFGLLPVILYIVVRIGFIKSWYILEPLAGVLSGRMVYGLVPMGLAFVILALSAVLSTPDPTSWSIWDVSFLAFIALGLLFTIWQPSWMRPRWVRWIEYEYGYCLDIMIEEARAMGRWNWEAQVRTRAGLERWAQEVLARRRKEIDERWEQERLYRLAPKWKAAGERRRFELEDFLVPKLPDHRRLQEQERLVRIEESLPLENKAWKRDN